MSDAIAAHAAFEALLGICRASFSNYIAEVAKALGRSQQTIRQYKAAPGSKSHRTPQAEAIEQLRELVINHRRCYSTMPIHDGSMRYRVTGLVQFPDYMIALDYADSYDLTVRTSDGSDLPALDDDARLRHEWRQIMFGGIVGYDVLAHIAGLDRYTVGWVGREHPDYGIQPTFEMVLAARAVEALECHRRDAA